jgi:hypothetical protein
MRQFSAAVARDAQTPDWLLEQAGFEPSSPFNSCSFHYLAAEQPIEYENFDWPAARQLQG